MKCMVTILRGALALALCAAGLAKLLFPLAETNLTLMSLLASVLELTAAALLISRYWQWGCVLTVLLAATFIVHTVTSDACTQCGCMGALTYLDKRGQITLAGSWGSIAFILLGQVGSVGRRKPKSHDP